MTHYILGETRRRSMLGALAAVLGALGSIATAVSPAAAQNGALIQTQPLYGAPDGAAAYRILYRSTGLSGEPIVVSGMVVIPQGDPPPGGRPIVAWAHPTTGVAPRCAPSLARVRFQMIQGLRDMVERGYVVTATDYPGLGTPQTHPYLVGDSEGRAVLDSVRAARTLPDAQAGSRFAVWGHSQGGQAALYTGLLARGYAPDLQLVGVAAAAPATELSALMRDDLGTSGGNNLTAMTLWSWARVYGAPIDRVVEPAAMPAVNQLANECIESIFDLFERRRTEKPLEHGFLSVTSLPDLQPWRSLLMQNTPGALPPDIPVFLAQGDADKLVRPAVTADYMRRLCRDGSSVRMVVLPGVGHGTLGRNSASAAVAWMADRFAGNRAPSDCGQ